MPKKSLKIDEEEKQQSLSQVKKALENAEYQIRIAKQILFNEVYEKKCKVLNSVVAGVIEGVFDGEIMIGADKKKYSVPSNYASKSKLIPGDKLKLTVEEDGTYIFKQIGPIERKKVSGILYKDAERYFVKANGNNYQVLGASVTFFKAEEGDRVYLIIPSSEDSLWGAVDNKAK